MFWVKHSTCTQLLETTNDWSISMCNSNTVDVLYFDTAKAFNTVNHKITSQITSMRLLVIY